METANRENESFSSEEPEQPGFSQISSQHNDIYPEESQTQLNAKGISSRSKQTKESQDSSKKSKPRIIMNVSDTRYEVIRYVGRKLLGYKLVFEPEAEWDIFWTDNAVQSETLAKMQPYQKINHFPGMYSLARKNHLGRNLMRMRKAFPAHYKFFPETYLLPAEYNDFKLQFTKKSAKTFILKPEASCQGRGIFLTRTWESVQPGEHFVAQRYLHKPYLIEGLKFDLRIYVLLAGCDPLRIYLYDDGLGRFATEPYVGPTATNMENMCMHLTNYAINKDNPNFVFNKSADDDNVGHKRSLKAVLKILEEEGHDVKALWQDIKKIIIKTFCSVQPLLAHSYKSCQPDEPYNNMCFEILGFDIILDHKLKPWLLEVNHTPSFTTDTPLDKTIKQNVIKDALTLMNISIENRIKYKNKKKVELQQRVLTGKKAKATPEERQETIKKAQQERDEWESKNYGGYEKIFPIDDPSKAEEDYGDFINTAYKWWEEWTGTGIKKNAKKVASPAENPNKLPPVSTPQIGTTATGSGSGTGPVPAPGSIPNMNTRAQEIKNVYSQKMKLGSWNRMASSSQKNRKTGEVPTTATKLNAPAVDTDTKPTDTQMGGTASDDLQPWAWNVSEVNPMMDFKVMGEDEKDNIEEIIPIAEQDSEIEPSPKKRPARQLGSLKEQRLPLSINPLEEIPIGETAQKVFSPSYSMHTEGTTTHSGTASVQSKVGSFRIRKAGATVPPKESSRKPTPNKVDKENSKTFFPKKPDTASHPVKPSTAAGNPMITKIPEKLAEIYGIPDFGHDKGIKTSKPTLRLGTGIVGESRCFEEKEATRNSLEPDRKVRSTNSLDADKFGASLKNGYYLKQNQKKPMDPLSLQQKSQNAAGNFVIPKMFELSFQAGKGEQPQRNVTSAGSQVYAGVKSFGRNIPKPPTGVKQKDANNLSANLGIQQTQEAHITLQKSSTIGLDVKK